MMVNKTVKELLTILFNFFVFSILHVEHRSES